MTPTPWLAPFIAIALSLSAYSSTDHSEYSDSGIFGPKYSDIVAATYNLATQYPGVARVVEYGKSVKGKPLVMLIVKRLGLRRDSPTLVMTGSTHGNEYLNIEDRLPEAILRQSRDGVIGDFLNDGGAFVFVPILNPDGYDARQRENAHGVDLNRDWDVPPAGYQGFKEAETKLLSQKLELLAGNEERLDYLVTVDYHCCIGAVLHPWSYKNASVPEPDATHHAQIGAIATKNLQIEVGTTGDILGYNPLGTTKDYYYVKYGAKAFTYEGRYKTESQYFPQHVAWWEGMVDYVSREMRKPFLTTMTKKRHPFFHFAD